MTSHTVPPAALDPMPGPPVPGGSAEPASPPTRPVYQPTLWSLAGLGAGVAGAVAVVSAGLVSSVYNEDLAGDAPAIVDDLSDKVPAMMAFHLGAMVSAVLLVVFAAGLLRRLRATCSPDSLAPMVAFSGVLLTVVVLVMGSGLDTEFIFAAGDPDVVVAENLTFYNHWIGTIPWCWGLLGLSGLALFAAARAGAVPRWIGLVGLLGGGLTLLVGISPLQYLAGMTGPLGLVVISLGFLVGDKAFRGRA